MVNATYTDEAVEREFGMDFQMHLCTRPARADLKDGHGGVLRHLIGATGPEAKHLCQKASRRFEIT